MPPEDQDLPRCRPHLLRRDERWDAIRLLRLVVFLTYPAARSHFELEVQRHEKFDDRLERRIHCRRGEQSTDRSRMGSDSSGQLRLAQTRALSLRVDSLEHAAHGDDRVAGTLILLTKGRGRELPVTDLSPASAAWICHCSPPRGRIRRSIHVTLPGTRL